MRTWVYLIEAVVIFIEFFRIRKNKRLQSNIKLFCFWGKETKKFDVKSIILDNYSLSQR